MKKVTIKADEATRKAASDAVLAQNACNGRALLGSLVEHLDTMLNEGTDIRNQHPVTITFLDKLASLAYTQNFTERVSKAHAACQELSDGQDVEWEIW